MKKMFFLLVFLVSVFAQKTKAQSLEEKSGVVKTSSELFPLKGVKLKYASNGFIVEESNSSIYKKGTQVVRNMKVISKNKNYTEYSLETMNKEGRFIKQKGFVFSQNPDTIQTVDIECEAGYSSTEGWYVKCTVNWTL